MKTHTILTHSVVFLFTATLFTNYGSDTHDNSSFPTVRSLPVQDAMPSDLLTVGDIKLNLKLPCNYVHDGFYLRESNEMLGQVYQSILEIEDDDVIPFVVEVGAHDGITKSISLKSSICLSMNTLLIEAAPATYKVLSRARRYDFTVHAALCNQDTVYIEEHASNSGENKIASNQISQRGKDTSVPVRCTTLDKEIDSQIRDRLPSKYKGSTSSNKIQLLFLVMDVEGHELTALEGLQKYSPKKMQMEAKFHTPDEKKQLDSWTLKHNLVAEQCDSHPEGDLCYNFHPSLGTQDSTMAYDLLYASRSKLPTDTHATGEASKAYRFYGEELEKFERTFFKDWS